MTVVVYVIQYSPSHLLPRRVLHTHSDNLHPLIKRGGNLFRTECCYRLQGPYHEYWVHTHTRFHIHKGNLSQDYKILTKRIKIKKKEKIFPAEETQEKNNSQRVKKRGKHEKRIP